MRYPSVAAGLILVFLSGQLPAHHNTGAAFDLEKEVAVEGTVSQYQFRNPHIYFYVVTDDDVEWRIEAGPTAIMKRFGWTRDTLEEGDQISLVGNPSRRSGNNAAYLRSATIEGVPLPASRGREAFSRLVTERNDSDQRASSLEGVWVTLVTEDSAWVDMPERMPLNEDGRQSISSFEERTMSPALRCIPVTAPSSMVIPDTKSIQILDDVVRIGSEFDGVIRVVHLSAADTADPSYQGHSTGTLDGNTLTIETRQFAAHRMGNSNGLASSTEKHLHETFVLDDDGKGLTYSFTLTDPVYLEETFSSEARWVYEPDATFEALPCDLETSRMFLKD